MKGKLIPLTFWSRPDVRNSIEQLPDQHVQMVVTEILLSSMNIDTASSGEDTTWDKEEEVPIYDTVHSQYPYGPVLRLYGKEGEVEQPHGYSFVPFINLYKDSP